MATKKATTTTPAISLDDVRQAAIVNLVNNLSVKEFKTGKKGYYAQGKITVDGVRFQSQIMLVEIEPK